MDEGRNMILLFPSLIKFKSKKAKANFDPTLVTPVSIEPGVQVENKKCGAILE